MKNESNISFCSRCGQPIHRIEADCPTCGHPQNPHDQDIEYENDDYYDDDDDFDNPSRAIESGPPPAAYEWSER